MSRFLTAVTAVLAMSALLAWGDSDGDSDHPPLVVAAWASGPMEARIALDRPIEQKTAEKLVGEAVPFQALDKLEKADKPKEEGKPLSKPSGSLHIAATRLEDEGRTLVLLTDPFPWEATYQVNLDGLAETARRGGELTFDLSGVDATWTSEGLDKPDWSGWWPHLDPEIVRKQTKGSREHERSLQLLSKPGQLTLRTLVQLPKGAAMLRLESNSTIQEASLNFEPAEIPKGGQRLALPLDSNGEPVELELTIRHDQAEQPLSLRIFQQTDQGPTEQELSPRQFTLPWAPTPPTEVEPPGDLPPVLAGGDPKRGKQVFFGEESRCSACHQYQGQGGTIGPDLSDLSGRDRAWVYREISDPSAEIDPNYVSFTIVLKDGRILAGIVRAEDAQTVRVLDTDAQETRVSRSEIEEMRPSVTSIMPAGLSGALGEQAMRDLLAFLTAGAD